MKLFNKVAIIGVGLIGGSIALAIKKKRVAGAVIGVSRRKITIALSLKKGAIDEGSTELSNIKDADLVILAAPISTILKLAPKISKFIKPDCVVTDVGSTKQQIVRRLDRVFPRYVGSHPLAGSEKQGVLNARPDIFKDSLCILTPTANTDGAALKKIKRLWRQLGAKVFMMNPDVHDKVLSLISHLAHIVAFSLIASVPDKYLKLAPSSLKDTTRIAASDAGLWADIFLSNKKNMLKGIELFEKNLKKIKSALRKKNRKLLVKILRLAKDKRDVLNSLMFKV